MRSLVVALIIHLTLNPLIFLKGWYLFKRRRVLQRCWTVIFISELLLYVVGFLFRHHLPHEIIHPISIMGTSWMLFLLYLGGLVLIGDLVYLLLSRNIARPRELLNQPQKIKVGLFLASIVVVVLALSYGSYRFHHPVVKQLSMEIGKRSGRMDSVKIAVVGDLHLGYLIDRNDARRMVELIMAQQPDLILFVGDILDSRIEPVEQQRMDEELRRLDAPLGIYSCTGNHEYRYEGERKIGWLNDAGITMLRDSAVLVDSSFYVVGREDLVIPDRQSLVGLLDRQEVDRSLPLIVLNHTPNNLDEEVDAGADIALYGHTHQGQAFPGNLATRMTFEVAYGYLKKGNTHIYVTSGLGLAGPQFRIGTVSEVVVLHVKFRAE